MNKQTKKNCCNGCQNGKIGNNPSCQAKRMVEAMKKAREEKETQSKT